MSDAHPLVPEDGLTRTYFEKRAEHLKKDLHSDSPNRSAGARSRVLRANPDLKSTPKADLMDRIRLGDLYRTIAVEAGYTDWRKLLEALGEAIDPAAPDEPLVPEDGLPKRMRFSFGDSSTGPVGGVIEVVATTVDEALHEIRKSVIAGIHWPCFAEDYPGEPIESVRVYLEAGAVQAEDLEEWEHIPPDEAAASGYVSDTPDPGTPSNDGVAHINDAMSPGDIGLNTVIPDYMRWESRDVDEKLQVRREYEDEIRRLGGVPSVTEDHEWAVEVQYELPLRAYFDWGRLEDSPDHMEYDLHDLGRRIFDMGTQWGDEDEELIHDRLADLYEAHTGGRGEAAS